jgi:hypothetical protein
MSTSTMCAWRTASGRSWCGGLRQQVSLGILNWVRRCAERWADGRFVLEQETNACAVLPESQWRGYRPPAEPAPGTWGDHPPPMLSAVAQAALEGDLAGKGQCWPSTRRTGRRPPWRGWGGRSWPATDEFSRSAADAEKHPQR